MDLHLIPGAVASEVERQAVDAATTGAPARHLLLPALHAAQARVGYISEGALNYMGVTPKGTPKADVRDLVGAADPARAAYEVMRRARGERPPVGHVELPLRAPEQPHPAGGSGEQEGAQRKQGGDQPEESEFEYQNHDEMVNR